MKTIIFGSSGQLGSIILKSLQSSNWDVTPLSRSEDNIDLKKIDKIKKELDFYKPDLIINCAAIIDFNYCEKFPLEAWEVNSLSSQFIHHWTVKNSSRYVYISTDQVYENKTNLSKETDELNLINNYAMTKFFGEPKNIFSNELTIRTSFIGPRSKGKAGFTDYIFEGIKNDDNINLFTNSFTSSLDDRTCAKLIKALIEKKSSGVVNLGTAAPYQKSLLGEKLIELWGGTKKSINYTITPVSNVNVNTNVGLCCDKIKKILGISMPNVTDVAKSIFKIYGDL